MVGAYSVVAVSAVVDALTSTVWPDTFNVPEEVSPVVEATPRTVFPVTFNVPDDVNPVVDALASTVCPETFSVPEELRPVVEAVASVDCPVTLRVPFEISAVLNVPLVPKKFVANDVVEVALVITDDDANTFCEKKLRKRRVLVPKDRDASVVGTMSPAW
jgi:hypothetical protein